MAQMNMFEKAAIEKVLNEVLRAQDAVKKDMYRQTYRLMWRTRKGVGYRWLVNLYSHKVSVAMLDALRAAAASLPYMEIQYRDVPQIYGKNGIVSGEWEKVRKTAVINSPPNVDVVANQSSEAVPSSSV